MSNIIEIELGDLEEFFDSIRDHGFVERIRINTARYVNLFSGVIDERMPQPSVLLGEEHLTTFDIVM